MFLERLTRAIAEGSTEIRFGGSHYTHAVCIEEGWFRVRRLVERREDAEAFLREHGHYTPENAEDLRRPGESLFESRTVEALEPWLAQRWPV
ncbi:MAG: hypothetical protein OEY14_07855 [Myxococcales bacterium]|nr:hypothetical protein [Myxococcales bacterium]